jgi:hypothetical protein
MSGERKEGQGPAGGGARLEVQNPGFWSVWKLLGRPQDWEVEDVSFMEDSVQHKIYDIRFFAHNRGICFRPIWPRFGEVWRPGVFQFLILHLRTIGFLRRVRKAAPTAPRALPSSEGSPNTQTPEAKP